METLPLHSLDTKNGTIWRELETRYLKTTKLERAAYLVLLMKSVTNFEK